MLFDQERMEEVIVVTRDKSRNKNYEEVREKLAAQGELNNIFKYLDIEINKYFDHYEKEGKEGHLKAVYICGSDWRGTPIDKIYHTVVAGKISHNEAFERSKQMVGCFLREAIMNSETQYVCNYYPEKGYVYSR